jgi:hypothetical protein
MIASGYYVSIEGTHRPFIIASVLSPAGVWLDVPFLIDTGADATFLDHGCIEYLGIDVSSLPIKDDAGGVAGTLSYYEFSTQLRLEGETDEARIFAGHIGILTFPEASDTPILGRDVLDHFVAIFDRQKGRILFIAEPDSYQVLRAS